MLKITTISLLFCIQLSYSQNLQYVSFYSWSNPKVFQIGASPFITGYGVLSDSISKANDGKTYYEHDDYYFEISSWADYYNWYVQEYWFYWELPELYQYYYATNDDYNMSSYIRTHFRGNFYPARVKPFFNDKKIGKRSSLKYPNNENQIRRLKKDAKKKNKQYENTNPIDIASTRENTINDYNTVKINRSKNLNKSSGSNKTSGKNSSGIKNPEAIK